MENSLPINISGNAKGFLERKGYVHLNQNPHNLEPNRRYAFKFDYSNNKKMRGFMTLVRQYQESIFDHVAVFKFITRLGEEKELKVLFKLINPHLNYSNRNSNNNSYNRNVYYTYIKSPSGRPLPISLFPLTGSHWTIDDRQYRQRIKNAHNYRQKAAWKTLREAFVPFLYRPGGRIASNAAIRMKRNYPNKFRQNSTWEEAVSGKKRKTRST